VDTLLKCLVDITSQRDHSLLDSSIVSALHELIGASQVRVHELFHFGDELLVRPRVWLKDGKPVSMDESLVAEGHPGEPIGTYPALADCLSQYKNCMEEITSAGDRVLWLPIWHKDKVHTCIEVTNPTSYDSRSRDVMESILRVYRNYQSILDYSERDSLTGLLNRKTFDERFSKMLTAVPAAQQDQPERRNVRCEQDICHWLAVVDIDHFKRVNDQFGHLYGDEVLLIVANLLRTSFRAQDHVFRFGGEEFVVLLRSTTLEEAHKIFERFRCNVEQHVFPQVGAVTVSVGFVRIANESPVVILGHADQALYYAKENGRNRVCHYDELVSTGQLHSEVSNDTVEFF